MKADDIIIAAQAKCTDLGATVPTAKSVYYSRIAIRQAQVFSLIADIHPDYFGVSTTVALVAGSYTLSNLNPKAERIVDVRVAGAGTSGLVTDDRINLVSNDDREAMLAPRATIRNGVLKGVGSDLAGVSTVSIDYSRQPSMVVVGTTQSELPEQFQDLLVLDLARQMIRKLLDVEPQRRDGWIELLTAEERELIGTLQSHVRQFVHGEQRRFRPPSIPSPAADNG